MPGEGLAGFAMPVEIFGTGFQPGATVTLDGAASNVDISSTAIRAKTPVHAPGAVDVVVTNPDGRKATLTAGYTFRVVTVTASDNVVAPGGQVTVSWVAPGRSNPMFEGDWLGFFRVGDSNWNFVWAQDLTGAAGTLTLNAPAQPGQYEFRYLLGDDFIVDGNYVDIARTSPVTVGAAGS